MTTATATATVRAHDLFPFVNLGGTYTISDGTAWRAVEVCGFFGFVRASALDEMVTPSGSNADDLEAWLSEAQPTSRQVWALYRVCDYTCIPRR